MKSKSIRDITILGLVILVLGVPGISKADAEFSQIYIFGDSLADPGNIFLSTGLIAKAPYQLIPDAPYAIGGHHFSNGKTWAEKFAQNMKLSEGGKSALETPGINGNYAFGGARARLFGEAPPAAAQVSIFEAHYAGNADPNALYVVQFGGNDLRDALEAFSGDPTGATSGDILTDAVVSISDNIVSLYSMGARQFLVANVPNLSRTPAVLALDSVFPGTAFLANMLGMSYNDGLESALSGLELGLPGISIKRLNFFDIVSEVADNPENFGITFTEAPCLAFGDPSGAKCSKPGEYLFWDGIHPTKVIHNAIGDKASDLFNGD